MKKLINGPLDVMRESLEGFAAAHSDILKAPSIPCTWSGRMPPSRARSASSRAAGAVTSPCTADSWGRACSMPPVPVRSSRPRVPIR